MRTTPGDSLGDRMKHQYENRTRLTLPRRTYTVIRIDGKAFHTYTRHLARPFDAPFMADMDATAAALCTEIQGAACAFVQSDEISVIVTDFGTITTDAWFDGNVQKIVSLAASIATAAFNRRVWDVDNRRVGSAPTLATAHFDARVFTIPDRIEVTNYLVWRQQDATRNSVQMAAQAHYSHRELHGCNQSVMQDMLHAKGVNWNDYPVGFKRGRMIVREAYGDADGGPCGLSVLRHRWVVQEPPIFTQDRGYLAGLIPAHPGHEAIAS